MLVGATGGAIRAQSPVFPANPTLDGLITQRMADARIMGLAAAVIVNREVVWMKGYGFADSPRTRPFTPNTVMNVGSVAKTFIGVAMMRAVQEGRLSLDEDINRYLPFRVVNPYRPNDRITLRHLATHTSGITDRRKSMIAHTTTAGTRRRPWAAFLRTTSHAMGSTTHRQTSLM
jgi:CubicO group peptidase (beta-lactamase class C family)